MGIRFLVRIFDLAQVLLYTGSPYDVTLPIYGGLSNLGIHGHIMFCSLDITSIHCIHKKMVKETSCDVFCSKSLWIVIYRGEVMYILKKYNVVLTYRASLTLNTANKLSHHCWQLGHNTIRKKQDIKIEADQWSVSYFFCHKQTPRLSCVGPT